MKVAVLGSGTMGHGIAQVLSQNGKYEVYLRAVRQESLERGFQLIISSLAKFEAKGKLSEKKTAILARIHPTLELEKAVKDVNLVIEAVPEKTCIKKAVLREVDDLVPEHVILASNTSSISITDLASVTGRPEKVCGMHFFNPPQLMKLVEIIRGKETSDETVNVVSEVSRKIGKEVVVLEQDFSVVNRVLFPALDQAVCMYFEGVSRDTVDSALKLGLNVKMGYLMVADYIGLDTVLSIMKVLEQRTNVVYHAIPHLELMVRKDMLGKKSGKGFYDW